MSLNRREFLHIMSMAAAAGMLPTSAMAMSKNRADSSSATLNAEMYQVPMKGNVRILHLTDTHAQLNPIYFREPNVNLGVGPAYNKLPHIVGHKLLKELNIEPNTPLAHAFTFLNFQDASEQYGKVGGFAHIKTLLDQLRDQAGGHQNTLTMDGGDLWHGSATALWTRGQDMVDASNLLGVDIMTGHWEFTYHEEEVLSNIKRFKGEFLAQNIRVKEDSLFGDAYRNMTEKHGGIGLYDEDNALPFKPYSIKEINGERIAIIGQAFPRTANANPRANFPDWSFGLREESLQKNIDHIRQNEKVAAIVMISHNGMDVDIKMASRVSGIDAIFGGHTHDGIPKTINIKTPEGGVCYVTNAGSNGKFVGCMDLDIQNGKLKGVNYTLLPVFSNLLAADKETDSFIKQLRQTQYSQSIIESRNPKYAHNPDRLGKTYEQILQEELSVAHDPLYRRGNFIGSWDQVIVNALREEHDTQIAMSAGVRWGSSVLGGQSITMERVMDVTSMTYGESYKSELTGAQIKDILEGVCENIFQKDPYLQSGGDMVRVGGLDYTCEPNGTLGSRISNMQLDNGTPIEASKKYTVSGWGQVETVGEGRPVWDVVADHLRHQKSGVTLNKVNHPVLKGVKTNPGIESYQGGLF
ncbi:5'-nucleotidase C-terminal domain-containing protein [Hydrogenovibrio sp. JE_KL2]|uniref:5'-nucleotidase C-terminal domain-containing protein n=1 Tax=Hydrogenovibrio sp. JE_KL2 TaxID=2651188 RepID=UPI00128B1D20|nr:5'-nucleotidase C-terminal domain-containing protein [Hydrogenovibrio sp. JE_KL2]MPQ77157.1 thiosulfohydrolase SoxB [Hydrogenovibrio sp. JE_KL2]